MVDVPRALPPSDAERLAILRSHGFPGNLAGESRNVGNPVSRDALAAGGVGGGSEGSLDEIDFKIDEFTVTDDATDTFELTFDPIDESWVASMSWRWANDRYSISGRTLTVTDPVDTFRGIAANGPRTLTVEYAYLTGVPTSPTTPATFPQSSDAGEQVGGNPEVEFDTAPAAGSSVLLAYRSKFGGLPLFVSGLGATWTAIHSADGIALWLGTGCNGTDTLITTDNSCLWIGIVEVTTALTATGAQTVDSTNGNELDLTATGAGVAVSLDRAGAGLENTPAAGLWSQMGNGSGGGATLRALVYAAGTGEAVGVNTNGVDDWDVGVLAVVRYA